MPVATSAVRSKDTDNVLLRMPSGLHTRVVNAARDGNISQNAFITTSLMFSTIVWGERPPMGKPQNILGLLDEVDRAIVADDAAIGAFHATDWMDVEPYIELLADGDLLDNLRVRRDTRASDTIVFSFTLTKTGKAAWQLIRQALQLAADCYKKEATTT